MWQVSRMAEKSKKSYYRITYRDPRDAQIVSLRAHTVTDSSLGLSFIAIADFYFESHTLVVNPAEEDLKKRYADVKTLHLSIYTIISIEEVGLSARSISFKNDRSNLVVLPSSEHPPKSS
jgi:hypothetical protein